MNGEQTKLIGREELERVIAARAVVLLDAQAPGWFEKEHLPGALEMPFDRVAELAPLLLPDRAAPIVVYCWSEMCVASQHVADALRGLGYRNVRRYAAGKQDWMNAGLPIQGSGAPVR
jgi:rhodanese-related sulfurtransferase